MFMWTRTGSAAEADWDAGALRGARDLPQSCSLASPTYTHTHTHTRGAIIKQALVAVADPGGVRAGMHTHVAYYWHAAILLDCLAKCHNHFFTQNAYKAFGDRLCPGAPTNCLSGFKGTRRRREGTIGSEGRDKRDHLQTPVPGSATD